MKYELVEFKNGKYGVRRRSFIENLFSFGGDFYDFNSLINKYYRTSRSNYFRDCQTADLSKAEDVYQVLTGKNIYRIIK